MAEAYIPGREITVAVMGNKPLGLLEIRPHEGFYDYDTKYLEGRAEHLIPAPIPETDHTAALDIAERAHRALGCEGVSRADFRYDDSEQGMGLRLLEINTQPGMTPRSLVPEIAAHAGFSFSELVDWMVEDAICRA
jgi:D-alanine-D-alanine ligase